MFIQIQILIYNAPQEIDFAKAGESRRYEKLQKQGEDRSFLQWLGIGSFFGNQIPDT